MSVLRRIAPVAVVLGALAAPARANPVEDADVAVRRAQALVDQARDLAHTAREIRDLLYYLSDPRGFQYDLYATQDLVLKDPILGPLARNLASLYTGRVWTATVQGQALADSATPGSVGVGASVAWDMPLCRLFEAQASGQAFYEDGHASGAMAWGVGGCLPLPFDTFELGYRGRRSVRASLLAVPILSGDRQSGDTVYSNLRFWRWLSAGTQVDVMPMSLDFDWASVGYGTSFQAYLSFAPVHWARRGKGYGGRDQTFDFMHVVIQTLGVDDGVYDPVVGSLSPLAIDGVAIGDHVQLGLDVGYTSGELYRGTETIPPVRHEAVLVDLSVIGGVPGLTVEVHARNAMQPTIYNQILDEDRLTGRLDVDRKAAWLRADGFASHARLFGVDRTSRKVWTYGAGADVTYALTPRLYGYVRGEAARGIVVDSMLATPQTALDLRGTIGVTTRLEKTW